MRPRDRVKLSSRWWLAPAMLAVFVAIGIAGATTAEAHAVLLSTSPAAGATAPEEPREVVLTFNETITGVGAVVRVTAPSGQVSTGTPRIIDRTVHQTLLPDAGGGAYRVDWRVISADGHPVSDTFTFNVAGPAATSPPASTGVHPSSPRGTRNEGTETSWGQWAAAALVALLVIGLLIRVRSRRNT